MTPACVVTGASSGIGAALAEAFALDGPQLLVARSRAGLEATARRVSARGGPAPVILPLDLHGADAGARIEEALAEHGLVADVLINNAGYGLHGPALSLSREEQLGILDLNCRAATDLALRLLPGMVARGRGGVMNVASIAAYAPGPFMAVYFASKAYLLSLSEALAAELEGTGVTVTALCPGPTESGFGRRARVTALSDAERFGVMTAEAVARLGREGFRRGARVVVTGARNQAASLGLRLLPHGLTLAVLRRVLGRRD